MHDTAVPNVLIKRKSRIKWLAPAGEAYFLINRTPTSSYRSSRLLHALRGKVRVRKHPLVVGNSTAAIGVGRDVMNKVSAHTSCF